ncbi:MAG: hypothetical protein V4550_16815 [Gemmatimonadota bacterium]
MTPAPDATPWEQAPSLRPTRHWPLPARRASRRLAMGGLLAAAATIAVVVWPRGGGLQASAVQRLTLSPATNTPGSIVTVRYTPAPWFRAAPRLVLVGLYSGPATTNRRARLWDVRVGDSLATLLPTRDGVYEGHLTLPATFLSVQLSVTDSLGEDFDMDGAFPWGAIARGADGKPTLAALLAANETFAEPDASSAPARVNPRVNVPDSLKKYFPDHPAGWAHASYGTKREGLARFIDFFESAERRYASFENKLSVVPSLDAERLHDMAIFAWRIEEPARAEFWVKRLVREHPEDPRVFVDLGRALHEIELREPRGLADSIRAWLPVLDSLYRRSPQRLGNSDAMSLVERYADAETKKLWEARFLESEAGDFHYYWGMDARPDDARDPSIVQRIRAKVAQSCTRPAGRFPLYGEESSLERGCRNERGFGYRSLAYLALVRGEPRASLAYSDSSVAMMASPACVAGRSSAMAVRARANLALGDTSAAERDLARAYGPYSPQGSRDSVRIALGARFNEARWTVLTDSTRRLVAACQRQSEVQYKARDARRRSRGQPLNP